MVARRDAEMFGDALANMREGVGNAERAAAQRRSEHQHRHPLARVVGAAPGRVAAVIGGQDDDIGRLQAAVEIRQARIERLERGCIAGDVAAMAVEHVEIDEIGEHQAAVRSLVNGREARVEERHVAIGLCQLGHALMREDVADLADRVNRAPGFRQPVEDRWLRRQHRIVAPVAGAGRYSRYKNPEYDKLLDQMAPLGSDDPTFQKDAAEALGIYWRDVIDIPIIQWLHRIPYNNTYWTNWPSETNLADGENGAFWAHTGMLEITSLKPTGAK